tara:strand:- start:5977 stop:6699 length:723 start_codon:yes stop_codon:yes gene_type:complete
MLKDQIISALTLVDDASFDLKLEEIANTKHSVTLGFLNQHAYNLMCKNSAVKKSFLNMDFMFRDGKGIELACRYHKVDPKKNLNGTDLIPLLINKLINTTDELTFFAYGTQEPWLGSGAENLFKTKTFYSLDGFQTDPSYVAHYSKFKSDKTDVIVLAMGMPKQERIAEMLKKQAEGPVIIICGGAILDFQAGRVKRAPAIFRKLGMEWFYRLVCEPKRLFVRYVIGIPMFFIRVYSSKK